MTGEQPSGRYLAGDATGIGRKIRSGEFEAGDVLEESIGIIQSCNPDYNAVIHPLFEKARAQVAAGQLGDGPFKGVPLVVKDLLCATAGDPYHAGMRLLRERNWTAKEDSYLAASFRRAGFVIVGRSNTPELGASASTEPEAYGPTKNPWDTDYSAGGSSGGSAAAVASGMVPVAHGNDMGGSIRIPASACGLLGLKPSRGRISPGPDHAEYWGPLAQDGILARSARDLAGVLDAIAGPMPGDVFALPVPSRPFAGDQHDGLRPLRFGLLPEAWDDDFGVDRECRKAVNIIASRLEKNGHVVSEGAPAGLAPGRSPGGPLIGAYIRRELDVWEQQLDQVIGPGDVEPWTWQLAELGRAMSATQYLESLEKRLLHARDLVRWWGMQHDILITPTMPLPPSRLGADPAELNAVCGTFTIPWNFTGQPAMSLPVHVSAAGLPVGAQLVAAHGREDQLIQIAVQLERERPWPGRSRESP